MTQEQYKRAVEIDKRIDELNEVKKELNSGGEHRLSYIYYFEKWQACPLWKMAPINAILDKHDIMIRQEIDEEIEKLKKEIEAL